MEDAVCTLLNGLKMDGYMAVSLEMIRHLNDLIGGVTVEIASDDLIQFDPAGMVVTLTDENGKKVDVPAEKFAEYGITVPTENLTKDQTKVEVKVKNKKVEQPITVKEKEFDKEKIAKVEIKTPPTKTKYIEGEKFDPEQAKADDRQEYSCPEPRG